MEPTHHNNTLTAETGRRGGLKRAERQSAQERSALARYAAIVRWHPPRGPGSARTSPGDHLPHQTGIKRWQATTVHLTLPILSCK
ncbi:MAG TPA: hypothetical protein VF026_13235 [Ktedonobacteraceae bacterium]